MEKSKRVNEIDLLRFVAALSVVLFHYTFRGHAADSMSDMPYPLLAPFSKYGYLGVELFFLISGFVILMTAASGNVKDFLVSRLVRLYPGFWACCTITTALIFLIGDSRFPVSIGQYLTNMTLMSGFVGVPPIDGAYWSIFVEIKFYALVFIVLLVKQIQRAQLLLVSWLAISITLEFLRVGWLQSLFITEYSAYFIAGAMFYLVWSEGPSALKFVAIALCFGLSLFQSIQRLAALEKHFATHMSSYIVAALVSSFFLVMLLSSLRLCGFFSRTRWLLAGVVTYPLYLLHQNIGYMIFNLLYPTINPHVLLWSTVIAVITMAYSVNIFFERRLSRPMKHAIHGSFGFIQKKLRALRKSDHKETASENDPKSNQGISSLLEK